MACGSPSSSKTLCGRPDVSSHNPFLVTAARLDREDDIIRKIPEFEAGGSFPYKLVHNHNFRAIR